MTTTIVLDVREFEHLAEAHFAGVHVAEALAKAAEVLRGGGLVAFPTETVYGLGANALDAVAVERIFTAKGRPANNPVIVHIAETIDALRVVCDWPNEAEQLAKRFWPGPLTLVLPRRPEVPNQVTAGGPTVAVRLPAHPIARALIRQASVPIAAPSANRSNRLSPTLAQHVLNDLDGRIDMILDGGPTPGGIESTVIDLSRHPPRLLRPGLIEPAALETVIGAIERPAILPANLTVDLAIKGAALPSPGLLARHYSPRTRMELVEHGLQRVRELHAAGLRAAWLVWFDVEEKILPAHVSLVRLPDNAAGYAAGLYSALHELDDLRLDRIVVALPPQGEEWLGVRDRLIRASG